MFVGVPCASGAFMSCDRRIFLFFLLNFNINLYHEPLAYLMTTAFARITLSQHNYSTLLSASFHSGPITLHDYRTARQATNKVRLHILLPPATLPPRHGTRNRCLHTRKKLLFRLLLAPLVHTVSHTPANHISAPVAILLHILLHGIPSTPVVENQC